MTSVTQTEAQEASVFARSVLEAPGVALPPAVVLDVGVIRERGWAVVEANPAWASGIYGCDPRRALAVIEGACISR